MMTQGEKLAIGVLGITGLSLTALWFLTRPKGNGNGNGPPPGPCHEGTLWPEVCYDGTQVITRQCIDQVWVPTGQVCPPAPPPPQNGEGPPGPGTVEWCRQQLEGQGYFGSYTIGEIQMQCPTIFSLMPGVPDFPKNPNQSIIIKALDQCGQPANDVLINLSQSTKQWGGFVVPGTNYVNCGPIQAGWTDANGELRVRYLCHKNPGPGVAQTVHIYVEALKGVFINHSCQMTVNGTHGAWPFDPFMITKEYLKGSGWEWWEC